MEYLEKGKGMIPRKLNWKLMHGHVREEPKSRRNFLRNLHEVKLKYLVSHMSVQGNNKDQSSTAVYKFAYLPAQSQSSLLLTGRRSPRMMGTASLEFRGCCYRRWGCRRGRLIRGAVSAASTGSSPAAGTARGSSRRGSRVPWRKGSLCMGRRSCSIQGPGSDHQGTDLMLLSRCIASCWWCTLCSLAWCCRRAGRRNLDRRTGDSLPACRTVEGEIDTILYYSLCFIL